MKRFLPILQLSILLPLLSGCISMPWHLRPEDRSSAVLPIPEAFKQSTEATSPPDKWWEEFNDGELNKLIDFAFADNLQLAAAWARLRQAEARAGVTRSNRLPTLTASGEASNTVTHTKTAAGWKDDSKNNFLGSLSVAYEIDLWGRLKALDAAALLTADASFEDIQSTGLLVAGQITSTWINIRTQQALLSLLEKQLKTNQETLELLEFRQRKGMASLVDVLQQKQQLANIESMIPPTRESLTLFKQNLAVLLGLPPSQTPDLEHAPLPGLPPLPGTGIPADVLGARPDVRAAWKQLLASDWDVVAARADRLPALRLTGAVSTNSDAIADILDNWSTNLAAALAGPIIDGGKRRAAVRLAKASADEAFIAYKGTILEALREVEASLVSETAQLEYVEKLGFENDLAQQTLNETRRRYRKGLTDYLPVLTALISQQRTERVLVAANRDLLLQRVSLYKALGGQVFPEEKGAPIQ